MPSPAESEGEHQADVSLPVEAFLHLLLGNRRLADLEATTPDCTVNTDTGAVLVDALFPRLPLSVWTMG